MSNQRRLCPVCRRPVSCTRARNICGHLDKAQQPCPASFEVPFDLCTKADSNPSDFYTNLRKARDLIAKTATPVRRRP